MKDDSKKSIDNQKNLYTIEEFAAKSGMPIDIVIDGIGSWIPWDDIRIQNPTEEQAAQWKREEMIPPEFIRIAVEPQTTPNGEVW